MRSIVLSALGIALVLGGALLDGPVAQPAPPASKPAMQLVVTGGPVPVDVEVMINDQFVATVGSGEEPLMQEIDDVLKPGENTVRLVARKAEDGRSGEENLRIWISPVTQRSSRRSIIEQPLFSAEVPAEATLAAECTETGRFSVGAPPKAAALKNQYWMFVMGPPTNHRVNVQVNGWTVTSLSRGHSMFDLTPYVVPGKNSVTFEGTRACFKPASGEEGPLRFEIGPAEKDHDVVEMKSVALVGFDLSVSDKRETFTKKSTFRAW